MRSQNPLASEWLDLALQGVRGLEGTAGPPGPPGPRVSTPCEWCTLKSVPQQSFVLPPGSVRANPLPRVPQGTPGTWCRCPLSLPPLGVRRKSFASSGKSWGSFIPARRFLLCCFPVFQLLVELEGILLVRLNSAGAGGCRQCEWFPPTSLPVFAARAGCRGVCLHSVMPRVAEL